MENPIRKALHEIKIGHLVQTQQLLILKAEDTVQSAVAQLTAKGVLSAPVIDSTNKVLGLVDMLDILRWVVTVAPHHDANAEKEKQQSIFSSFYSKEAQLEMAGRAMSMQTLAGVIDASGRDPLVPLYVDSPATMAVEMFTSGIHRSLIFTADMRVVGIVSQSSLLRTVKNMDLHRGNLKLEGNQTLEQLGLAAKSEVVSVSPSTPVMVALAKIKKNSVSALAVVNEEGRLVGNFSASDVKSLMGEKIPSLMLPVSEYLEQYSPNSLKPVVCRSDMKLIDFIDEMVNNSLHRMWVIDADFKPVTVVTLTDLMKLFSRKEL